MRFTTSQLNDINLLAEFLACDQTSDASPAELTACWPAGAEPDLAILLGNAVLDTAERLFQALQAGMTCPLLIAGGIGHSTPLLYQAVLAHPTYHRIPLQGRAEADILYDIATEFWQLSPARILVENLSTNCGDNARQAARVVRAHDINPARALLTQDPLMQRRTDASFRHEWHHFPGVNFINWPTFIPRLVADEAGQVEPSSHAGWTLPRLLSMLLGEIPRLRNAPGGYGPRGAGYIARVDIPVVVEQAYARLFAVFGQEFGIRL